MSQVQQIKCHRCTYQDPKGLTHLPPFMSDPEGFFCGMCYKELTDQRKAFSVIQKLFNFDN
jgi:hypothetical protein